MPDRILYINHVCQMSGAAHSLTALITTLPRDRYEPVVAIPEGGKLWDWCAEMGLLTVAIPLRRIKRSVHPRTVFEALLSIYRSRRKLRESCRNLGIRLIHSNSTISHFVGGDVARFLSLPAI